MRYYLANLLSFSMSMTSALNVARPLSCRLRWHGSGFFKRSAISIILWVLPGDSFLCGSLHCLFRVLSEIFFLTLHAKRFGNVGYVKIDY